MLYRELDVAPHIHVADRCTSQAWLSRVESMKPKQVNSFRADFVKCWLYVRALRIRQFLPSCCVVPSMPENMTAEFTSHGAQNLPTLPIVRLAPKWRGEGNRDNCW